MDNNIVQCGPSDCDVGFVDIIIRVAGFTVTELFLTSSKGSLQPDGTRCIV